MNIIRGSTAEPATGMEPPKCIYLALVFRAVTPHEVWFLHVSPGGMIDWRLAAGWCWCWLLFASCASSARKRVRYTECGTNGNGNTSSNARMDISLIIISARYAVRSASSALLPAGWWHNRFRQKNKCISTDGWMVGWRCTWEYVALNSNFYIIFCSLKGKGIQGTIKRKIWYCLY